MRASSSEPRERARETDHWDQEFMQRSCLLEDAIQHSAVFWKQF